MAKAIMAWYLTDWRERYEPKVRNGKRLVHGLTYWSHPVYGRVDGRRALMLHLGDPRSLEILAAEGILARMMEITAILPSEYRGYLLRSNDHQPHTERTISAELSLTEAECRHYLDLLKRAHWIDRRRLRRKQPKRSQDVQSGQDEVTARAEKHQKSTRNLSEIAKRESGTSDGATGYGEIATQFAPKSPPQQSQSNSSVRDTAVQSNSQSQSKGAAHPRNQNPSSKSNGPQSLSGIFSEGVTGAAAGKNGNGARADILTMLGDRGCDADFRGLVSKRADSKLVKQLAAEFDRQKEKITNPGGWWRQALRREGVKGV